jgi:Xaa-Pro aminopeptidase
MGKRSTAAFEHAGHDLMPGQPVCFDAGGSWNRYWTDTGRTLVVGAPSQRSIDIAATEAEGLAAVQAAAQPGVTGGEVWAAFDAVARKHGLPGTNWYWGHGVGLELYEYPRVRRDSPDVLESGMLFNFEAPFRQLGLGGLHMEDTFEVEAGGSRRLSTLPRTLITL